MTAYLPCDRVAMFDLKVTDEEYLYLEECVTHYRTASFKLHVFKWVVVKEVNF